MMWRIIIGLSLPPTCLPPLLERDREDCGKSDSAVLDFIKRCADAKTKNQLQAKPGNFRYQYDWNQNDSRKRSTRNHTQAKPMILVVTKRCQEKAPPLSQRTGLLKWSGWRDSNPRASARK